MDLLKQKQLEINRLCQKHNVGALYAFGSVLRADFSAESDIDLLVRFDDVNLLHYADNYFSLKFSLEDIFSRKIDLLEIQALKNPYLLELVEKTKKLIYEKGSKSLAV